MPYCVECGVKLAEHQEACPLCNTKVMHPDYDPSAAPPVYPEVYEQIRARVIGKGFLTVASLLMLLAAVITVTVDVAVVGSMTWSFIVVLSLLLFWSFTVLPFLVRSRSAVFRVSMAALILAVYLLALDLWAGGVAWSPYAAGGVLLLWLMFLFPSFVHHRAALVVLLDTIALGVYVWGIAVSLGAPGWFWPLAFPIISTTGVLTLGVMGVHRLTGKFSWKAWAAVFFSVGILNATIDLVVSSFLAGGWSYQAWSLYVFFSVSVVAVILLFLGSQREILRELRKRLHI